MFKKVLASSWRGFVNIMKSRADDCFGSEEMLLQVVSVIEERRRSLRYRAFDTVKVETFSISKKGHQ